MEKSCNILTGRLSNFVIQLSLLCWGEEEKSNSDLTQKPVWMCYTRNVENADGRQFIRCAARSSPHSVFRNYHQAALLTITDLTTLIMWWHEQTQTRIRLLHLNLNHVPVTCFDIRGMVCKKVSSLSSWPRSFVVVFVWTLKKYTLSIDTQTSSHMLTLHHSVTRRRQKCRRSRHRRSSI